GVQVAPDDALDIPALVPALREEEAGQIAARHAEDALNLQRDAVDGFPGDDADEPLLVPGQHLPAVLVGPVAEIGLDLAPLLALEEEGVVQRLADDRRPGREADAEPGGLGKLPELPVGIVAPNLDAPPGVLEARAHIVVPRMVLE